MFLLDALPWKKLKSNLWADLEEKAKSTGSSCTPKSDVKSVYNMYVSRLQTIQLFSAN